MGQSRPLLVYFRPFLITISIIQIEKGLGFEPAAARRRRNHGAIPPHWLVLPFGSVLSSSIFRNELK